MVDTSDRGDQRIRICIGMDQRTCAQGTTTPAALGPSSSLLWVGAALMTEGSLLKVVVRVADSKGALTDTDQPFLVAVNERFEEHAAY